MASKARLAPPSPPPSHPSLLAAAAPLPPALPQEKARRVEPDIEGNNTAKIMAHAFDAEYSRTGMVSRYERSSTGWCTFVWSFGDKPGKFYVRNVIVVSLNEGGHD